MIRFVCACVQRRMQNTIKLLVLKDQSSSWNEWLYVPPLTSAVCGWMDACVIAWVVLELVYVRAVDNDKNKMYSYRP